MEEFFKPIEKTAYASLPFITRPDQPEMFSSFASESDAFEVFLHRNVQETIRCAAREAVPNETFGLLAGRVLRDERGPYTLVLTAAGARVNEVEATPSHVRISASGQAAVRRRLETSAYGLDIIGWYHSHPRFPARFSSIDITEQSTWRDPNHVGIVISGVDEVEPLGVYRGPKSALLVPKSTLSLFRPIPNPQPRAVVALPAMPAAAVSPASPIDREAETHAVVVSTSSKATTPRSNRMAAFIYLALGVGLLGMVLEIIWLDHRLRNMEERLTHSRPDREQGFTVPPEPSPSLATSIPLNISSDQDISTTKPEVRTKPLSVQRPAKPTTQRLKRKKGTATAEKSTPNEKEKQ
jgi:proteasome lid subunit RPN8/RPN11